MRKLLLRTLVICLLTPAAVGLAEDRPFSTFHKTAYGYLKIVLLRSAEKMPEADYAFKPTEGVRSFGQVLGHVADSQYLFCSMALGETNPAPKVETTKTTKAELIAALKEAFAYCDKAHASMTEASAAQMVKFHGQDMSRLDVLTVNNMHSVEHYGNIVTYLRLKNIVPPSSEAGAMPEPKK